MTIHVEKRLFSVHEYHRIAEAGVLHEDDRVELIEGEIVEMTPVGACHVGRVMVAERVGPPSGSGSRLPG